MPREKEHYREHLMALYERFGNAEIISLAKAASYIGLDKRTLLKDKTFPIKRIGSRYFVPVKQFASWLS